MVCIIKKKNYGMCRAYKTAALLSMWHDSRMPVIKKCYVTYLGLDTLLILVETNTKIGLLNFTYGGLRSRMV